MKRFVHQKFVFKRSILILVKYPDINIKRKIDTVCASFVNLQFEELKSLWESYLHWMLLVGQGKLVKSKNHLTEKKVQIESTLRIFIPYVMNIFLFQTVALQLVKFQMD